MQLKIAKKICGSVFFVTSFALAGDDVLSSPVVVLETRSNVIVVTKENAWKVLGNKIHIDAYGASTASSIYAVSSADAALIESCFRGVNCDAILTLKNSVDQVPKSNRITVLKLSDTKLLAQWELSWHQILIVDLPSRTMISPAHGGPIAFDPVQNEIYLADCWGGDFVCKVYKSNLDGRNKTLLSDVEYDVVDLYSHNETLFALARKRNSTVHFPNILAPFGHGSYYHDWYILEISPKSGQVRAVKIADDLPNAGGGFQMKWRANNRDGAASKSKP